MRGLAACPSEALPCDGPLAPWYRRRLLPTRSATWPTVPPMTRSTSSISYSQKTWGKISRRKPFESKERNSLHPDRSSTCLLCLGVEKRLDSFMSQGLQTSHEPRWSPRPSSHWKPQTNRTPQLIPKTAKRQSVELDDFRLNEMFEKCSVLRTPINGFTMMIFH